MTADGADGSPQTWTANFALTAGWLGGLQTLFLQQLRSLGARLVAATPVVVLSCSPTGPSAGEAVDIEDAGPRNAVPRRADAGSQGERDCLPLVSAGRWREVAAEDDPFLGSFLDASSERQCDAVAGWYPEAGGLEIDTGRCNYVTLTQPLPMNLAPGSELLVEVLHFDLTAPEPTRAEVALQLGDELLWVHQQPIPSEAGRIEEHISISNEHEQNSPLFFHLHNHGQNSWRLMGLWKK